MEDDVRIYCGAPDEIKRYTQREVGDLLERSVVIAKVLVKIGIGEALLTLRAISFDALRVDEWRLFDVHVRLYQLLKHHVNHALEHEREAVPRLEDEEYVEHKWS